VKLSFFGEVGMGRVGAPSQTDDGILSVASPLDLLATKLKVIMQRAEAKDYIDIAQLLRDGSSLSQGLGAARSMYGSAFAPAECLRALTFYDDGDLAKVDTKVRQELRVQAARAYQVFPLPIFDIVNKQLGE
jgi:predicted nucleotidyltransferase component of viral defense system